MTCRVARWRGGGGEPPVAWGPRRAVWTA